MCFSGIKRSKLHLSAGSDIDFIDTIESSDDFRQLATSSSQALRKQRSYSTTSADLNANNKLVRNASQPRKNSVSYVSKAVDCVDESATAITKEIVGDANSGDSLNRNTSSSNLDQSEYNETVNELSTPVEGISNWKKTTDDTFGIAVSLYEKNLINDEYTGSPIADCFGVISRTNSSVLVLADGVNWGENAKLAARAATFGW